MPTFPYADALCESCGYSLRGLTDQQICPECGTAIEKSSPAHRPGLPWQTRIDPISWLVTVFYVIVLPGRAFRMMRIDSPIGNDRLFLWMFAIVMGASWGGARIMNNISSGWIDGFAITLAIVGLTYLEVLGVTFFSRRKGWPIKFRTAERVACYSAIGWVPGSLMLVSMSMLTNLGYFSALYSTRHQHLPYWTEVVVFSVIALIAMFWFEWLVWFGMRKVRFANRYDQAP